MNSILLNCGSITSSPDLLWFFSCSSSVWLCNPVNCSIPGFSALHHVLELIRLMFIESVMPSKHLISCHPLLLMPPIFPSIRIFSSESPLWIRWPKHWSFSFSISPSNKHSRLISFRIDWFDFFAVQGTLKSLLQHHSSKHNSLVLSLLHGSTLTSTHNYWKNLAFTRWTLAGEVTFLLFNMLSRLVISFLPRSKCLLTSWLQSQSAVILQPKKIKSLIISIVSTFAKKRWEWMPWS